MTTLCTHQTILKSTSTLMSKILICFHSSQPRLPIMNCKLPTSNPENTATQTVNIHSEFCFVATFHRHKALCNDHCRPRKLLKSVSYAGFLPCHTQFPAPAGSTLPPTHPLRSLTPPSPLSHPAAMVYLVLTQAQCFFAKFGTTCTMSVCPCPNRTLPTTRGSGVLCACVHVQTELYQLPWAWWFRVQTGLLQLPEVVCTMHTCPEVVGTMCMCPCPNRTLPTTMRMCPCPKQNSTNYHAHVSVSKQNSTNYHAHVSMSKQDSSNYQR